MQPGLPCRFDAEQRKLHENMSFDEELELKEPNLQSLLLVTYIFNSIYFGAFNKKKGTKQGHYSKLLSYQRTHKYRLWAFIEHLGQSLNAGHYIKWMKKDQHWLLFDDHKVRARCFPLLLISNHCFVWYKEWFNLYDFHLLFVEPSIDEYNYLVNCQRWCATQHFLVKTCNSPANTGSKLWLSKIWVLRFSDMI